MFQHLLLPATMATPAAINSKTSNTSTTSSQCSNTNRHSTGLFSRMALATSSQEKEEEGEECQPQHTANKSVRTTTLGTAATGNKDDDSTNSSDGSDSCSSGWSASTPSFDDDDLDLPDTYKNLLQENKHRNRGRKFHECYCKEKRLQNGAFGIVYEASRIVPISPEVEIVSVPSREEGEGNPTEKQEEEKKEQDTIDDTASTTSITATPTTQATKYAVKQIDRTKLKTKRDDTAVFREVCILNQLVDVPNVITLVDFFVEPKTLYVVLTLAAGGDVFDRLIQRKTYTEQFARELAQILLRTLSMIHDRNIVHRDLKPGNLLLASDSDDCSILLADFGFATKLHADGYCRTRCGTPMYVAPEVILDVPYTQKVDMWSCGCILYLLLCGYPPFRGEHHRDLFRRIRAGNFTFHEATWGNVSIPAKQLIAKLLTVNPKHRWTASQALEEASWFKAKTTDPLHLSENDLSEALTRIRSRRKLKAAMDAVRWAATARFWNPEKVTFAQTVKKWDRSLSANARTTATETDPQRPQSARSLSTTPTTTPPSGNSEGTNSSLGSTTSSANGGATAGVITTMPPPPDKPVKLAHFDERYMLLRKVRKGAYATVWECRRKDGAKKLQTFAVKIIPRPCLSLDHDEQVLNEVSILQSVSAEAPEQIVDLVDFYEEEDAFYIVMELMTGGDVFDRVTQRSCYSERDARDLIKRLLEAVDILHKKGIAHRGVFFKSSFKSYAVSICSSSYTP